MTMTAMINYVYMLLATGSFLLQVVYNDLQPNSDGLQPSSYIYIYTGVIHFQFVNILDSLAGGGQPTPDSAG